MNSRERFIATVERKPVDRPACWLGDPTPGGVPALCDYYHVDNIKELKKVCGDDFYAVEIPYKSPTCSAIFAAFDWVYERKQCRYRAQNTDSRRMFCTV